MNETSRTTISGVDHVGILAVPIANVGLVLYVFIASIASSVKTHMLLAG
jgi:hypothetical protein